MKISAYVILDLQFKDILVSAKGFHSTIFVIDALSGLIQCMNQEFVSVSMVLLYTKMNAFLILMETIDFLIVE